MLVKDGDRKAAVGVPGRGHLPGSGEARLARACVISTPLGRPVEPEV